MEYNDITETGYNNYRDLLSINDSEYEEIQSYLDSIPPKKNRSISNKERNALIERQQLIVADQRLRELGVTPASQMNSNYNQYNFVDYNLESQPYTTNVANTSRPFGESRYDNPEASDYEIQHILDVRSNTLSGFNKIVAGTAKGAVLAGTTFIDGTLGLMVGIPEAAAAWATGDSFRQGLSKLFNNEISNGTRYINELMENILPNYSSEYENSRAWYQNMGTANFWADFIKQIGFTVGAFYSGNAWTKALKAANWVNSAMGARVTGSLLSAANEARIEANNNSNDWKKLELEKFDYEFNREKDRVMADYYNGKLSDEQANAMLEQLYQNKDAYEKRIEERANKVGVADMALNIPILAINDFFMFGKAYSRGFNNANKNQLGKRTFKEVMKQAGEELGIMENDLALNTVKQAGRYTWNPIKTSKAFVKGSLGFLREGNEEVAQAFAAEYAKNEYTPDSPDAYQEALYDPLAIEDTKNFYRSITEGFASTYGNIDTYKEFFMGGLNGLLGFPTFGRSQNMSDQTWIGHGKPIGITGGLAGVMREARLTNRQGSEAVEFMNSYLDKYDKSLSEGLRHFAASDHFTNLMNGWAEESNAFEYKNAQDNDDFEAIVRFNSVGKLDDFKQLVNQDFDNMSDAELDKIAKFTTSNEQWKNSDGTYKSESEEGRAEMRKILTQNKVKLLKEVEDFEKAYETMSNITNDDLDQDKILELSWLKWKLNRFSDRFKEVKKDNKDFFNDIRESAADILSSVDESEQGKKYAKAAENIKNFIDYIDNSKDPLEMSRKAGANFDIIKNLQDLDSYNFFANASPLSYDEYKKAVTNLVDLAKMGKLAEQFDSRLKEYLDAPSKMDKNKSRIRKKIDDAIETKKASLAANDMLDMDIETLSVELDNDNLRKNEDGDYITSDGVNLSKGLNKESKDKLDEKYDQAERLKKEKDEVISLVEDKDIEIDTPITDDDVLIVTGVIDLQFQNGERILELDIDAIDSTSLLNLYEMDTTKYSDEDRLNKIGKRTILIATAIKKAKENIDLAKTQKDSVPNETHTDDEVKSLPETTGPDPVVKTPSVNDKDNSKEDDKKNEPEESQSVFIDEKEIEVDSDALALKPIQELNFDFDEVMIPFSDLPLSNFRSRFNLDKYDYRSLALVVKDLSEKGNSPYSDEMRQYIFAVDSFLRTRLAFENRNNGLAQTGHKVTFVTSQKLNEDAGVKVILMQDEQGNIIGSLTPSKFGKKNAHSTLSVINIERFITDDFDNDLLVIKNKDGNSIESRINGDYIGILPVSKDSSTVLDVFGTRVNEIEFGIVKESGVNNGIFTTKSDFPNSDVRPPSKSKVGQVFLLLKTTSSEFPKVTVNMFIPRFNKNMQFDKLGNETHFYKLVRHTIDKIVAANDKGRIKSNEVAADVKSKLNYLFSNQNFGVEFDLNTGKITSIHIGDSKGNAETTRIPIYESSEHGELTSEKLYDILAERNFPINVSLGSINKDSLVDGVGVPYNTIIALIALAKIVPNVTHTLNDFFTIDLIDENGKAVNADQKPHRDEKKINDQFRQNESNTGRINTYNWDYVDNESGITYEVSDDVDEYVSNPLTESGARERLIDRAKAYAAVRRLEKTTQPIIHLKFGDMFTLDYDMVKEQLIIPGQSQSQQMLISTPEGLEIEVVTPLNVDAPSVLSFKATPKEAEQQVEQPSVATSFSGIQYKDLSIDDANNWFDSISELSSGLDLDWNDLSDDQKKQIFAVSKIITPLEAAEIIFSIGLTGESQELDSLISGKPLYRVVSISDNYSTDIKKEVEWLKLTYPELSDNERFRIVDGLIRVLDSNTSDYAWGMFKNGVIYISNVAAGGTVYHEAFHSVAHTLLTQKEYNRALNIVRKKNPYLDNIQLEEILAEEFRGYMQTEYTGYNDNFIVRIFKQLKNLIKSIFNKQYALQNLYYRISQGRYLNRALKVVNDNVMYNPTNNTFTLEMQDIKALAIADGTFMKAPNGNPTNLTERQWLQVRTQNFLNWFGDWINDPANASKVVDENGEPLPVYHHTDNPNLTEFSTDFENYFSKDGGTKEAIFFDENKTGTLGRKYDIPVFLNIRELNEYNETKQQLHDRGTTYREIVNQSAEKNNKDGGVHMKDFDDNRMEHQSIWIVHNPNQIKSATDNNGEFSDENNVIYYRTVSRESFGHHVLLDAKDYINRKPLKVGSDVVVDLVTGKNKFMGRDFSRPRQFINLATQWNADYSSDNAYDTTGRSTRYNQSEVLKLVQKRIDESNLNGLVSVLINEFGIPELVPIQREIDRLFDYYTTSQNQQGQTMQNNNLIRINREALKFFEGKAQMSASEVLDKIALSDSGFSDLAMYMSEKLNSLNNIKVRLVSEEEFYHLEGLNHKGQGIFDPYTNTVYISETNRYYGLMFNRILMHELVHALAYNSKKDATSLAKLQSIFNDARKLIKRVEGKSIEQLLANLNTASIYYGLTNMDEFLSECISNPVFVKRLNDYGGSSVRSVINRIKNWFLNVFKVKKTSDIYDRAIEFIDDMINNQYESSDVDFGTREMYEQYYNDIVGSQEYYEGIREYHNELMFYENLDPDQIKYIQDNNVGYYEYLNMTQEEKENFWKCS